MKVALLSIISLALSLTGPRDFPDVDGLSDVALREVARDAIERCRAAEKRASEATGETKQLKREIKKLGEEVATLRATRPATPTKTTIDSPEVKKLKKELAEAKAEIDTLKLLAVFTERIERRKKYPREVQEYLNRADEKQHDRFWELFKEMDTWRRVEQGQIFTLKRLMVQFSNPSPIAEFCEEYPPRLGRIGFMPGMKCRVHSVASSNSIATIIAGVKVELRGIKTSDIVDGQEWNTYKPIKLVEVAKSGKHDGAATWFIAEEFDLTPYE